MARTGRPSSYKPEFAQQAEKLCALGATDSEIADFFEATVRTLYRWKLDHPDFCHALKVGKDITDDRVERSLMERATGYRFVEQQAIKVKVAGGGEEVQVIDVERAMPPDTTAMIFWLKNRRRDTWRDRHEHTGADDGPINLIIQSADKALC